MTTAIWKCKSEIQNNRMNLFEKYLGIYLLGELTSASFILNDWVSGTHGTANAFCHVCSLILEDWHFPLHANPYNAMKLALVNEACRERR